MNRKKVESELHEDSIIYRDFLIDKVPVRRVKESFDLACNLQKSSFAPNAFDINQAWQEIDKRERAERLAQSERERLENPVKFCSNRAYHVDKFGTILKVNPFDTTKDVEVPCWECRRTAHDDVWARFLDKNGRKELPPLEIVESLANLIKPQPTTEEIPFETALDLVVEHNNLIAQIVAESEQQHFLLVFDEGGNCFARKNYRARTFTAKAVEKMIEDYRRVLEK